MPDEIINISAAFEGLKSAVLSYTQVEGSDIHYDDTRLFATGNKYELMFRLLTNGTGIYPDRTIVIAKLYVPEKRAGHGKNIVKLVSDLGMRVGFRNIYIESTNGESGAFAKSLGFRPLYDQPIYSANHWFSEIADLKL